MTTKTPLARFVEKPDKFRQRIREISKQFFEEEGETRIQAVDELVAFMREEDERKGVEVAGEPEINVPLDQNNFVNDDRGVWSTTEIQDLIRTEVRKSEFLDQSELRNVADRDSF